MNQKNLSNLEDIKLLAMDVDGVLTDATIVINTDRTEGKRFNLLDGHGIRMWHRAGFQTALISGRASEATSIRAEQLEIKYVFQGGNEKLSVFEKLLTQTDLSESQVAYIGDDVMDLPLVRRAGFGVAVENAVDELKEYADYITTRRGGAGAVREVIELLLKSNGKWNQLMQRYLL